ncbi:hypothetical protein HAX54_038755, partial [Datura stramonium]|nr:hypothetical protein [Datura stramonium]
MDSMQVTNVSSEPPEYLGAREAAATRIQGLMKESSTEVGDSVWSESENNRGNKRPG